VGFPLYYHHSNSSLRAKIFVLFKVLQ